MAKDPAVLFYTQDFLVGSSMLSPLQKGHYITLLCHQQQSTTGSLKVDEIKILMGRDFEKHWPVLQAKFKSDGNGFYNERMRIEIEKRKAYSESRRKNKLKDPNLKTMSYDTTYDEHMEIAIERRNNKGGVGEIGIEKVASVANDVWNSQQWKESICMGCSIKEPELKKWMALFNSSVSNDSFPAFDASKYKKLFRGWLMNEKQKGRTVEIPIENGSGLPGRLKNINGLA